ncbi:MAG: amidohydrolase [Rikenellaceae bacterium]
MKISLIQTSIKWLDVEKNQDAAKEWIIKSRDKGADLCIFSEMFTTGFCMDPSKCAQREESVEDWFGAMADEYDIAIGGGVAIEQDGGTVNRFYIVEPNGRVSQYDKRHLFTFAGEQNYYTPGVERVVVEIKGVMILLLVCYDLRFPVWCRNTDNYDVMLCIANWPKSRRFVWDTLLRSRAIENVCYVGGVNIVGEDPSCVYSGGTAAINFRGEAISQVEDDAHGIAIFDVDLEALQSFRAKFPALEDMDKFEIK